MAIGKYKIQNNKEDPSVTEKWELGKKKKHLQIQKISFELLELMAIKKH